MQMTHLIMLNSLGDSLLVLRGGLNIPGHNVCEWVCFCYIIFYSVVKDVSLKFL